MALVKGPFNFKWGDQELHNISEISVDYTVDSSDTTTLDGNRFSTQTGMGMTVSLTLLDNDIESLALILPQYYKDGITEGQTTLSTGETVAPVDTEAGTGGAIDIAAASCTTSEVYNDLDIIACGTNAQVLRLVNARTQIDSIDIDDGLRTVTVMFIGEPTSGQAVVQLFADGDVTPAVS